MKKFTLIVFLALGGLFLQGQNAMLSYTFNNSLAESKGNGPTLKVLDSVGMYVLDTLNEVSGRTKTVYRFIRNSGVQFDNALAGNFIDSTYSIELYFVFDELGSWKRVIDWKNRKTDYGAYVYNGQLNFYPYIYSDTAPVVAGEYTYYTVTRDKATKNLKIYTDARTYVNFIDAAGDAVMDTAHVLNFFQDDRMVPNEASSGAVALLNIYNYVLDSATIKHKFDSLRGQLFAIRENTNKAPAWVFPNPANDVINVSLQQFSPDNDVSVSLINSTGTVVFKQTFPGGSTHRIDLKSLALSNGIYLAKAESASKTDAQKFIIRK
jgi:hypothetical protein